jgi:uncharacterized protein (TIGR04255 family)
VPGAEPEFEDFASAPPVPPQLIQFQFEHDPNAVRCWFLTTDDTELIQVQRNRFIQNWRKVKGDEVYPRYDTRLRPAFAKRHARYLEFLVAQGLSIPTILQIELTYINDLVPGEGWGNVGDLHRLLTPWRGEYTHGFLPSPYGMRIGASYAMPEQRGRLHLNIQRVVRPRDQHEILQFRLTARVKPTSGEERSILEAFDLARDWIVNGFTDWTTPTMHKIWGRST